MTNSTPDIARIAAGLSERVREVLAETKAMHREYLERSERRHAEAMASLAESSAVLTARMPSGAKPMTNATTTDRLAEVLHQMATFQDGNAQPHTIALINELADIAQSQQAENERLRDQCEAFAKAVIELSDNIEDRDGLSNTTEYTVDAARAALSQKETSHDD